jgi:hypothetical protein
VDERVRARVDLRAVELEFGVAGQDEVELLLGVGLVLGVLIDDPLAGLAPDERVDTQRRDAEVLADRPVRDPPVTLLRDLVEPRRGIGAHPIPPFASAARQQRPR